VAKYPNRWAFFQYLNIVSIILALSTAIFSIVLLSKLFDNGFFRAVYIIIFSSMIVIILFAIFILKLLKHKYPSAYISDRSERGAYLFIIIVCFIVAFLILFDAIYIDFIIDNIKQRDQLPFKYLVYTIVLLMALDGIVNVIIVIFSFNLLASISKNRSSIIKEIDAIGTNS
jgi:hypothetical protein